MRDQLVAQVPTTAEQVHVRQILLYSSDQANEVLTQLKADKDFAALAAQYDPLTFGDLGWSPRRYLLDPKLEEAVFSLQPGQFSDVIQTSAGFHIIQVIERESQRPLESNALLALQLQALDNWLQERRNQSQIQFLLP
jgi:peptidyl-prolyl cis-trans isomerase C